MDSAFAPYRSSFDWRIAADLALLRCRWQCDGTFVNVATTTPQIVGSPGKTEARTVSRALRSLLLTCVMRTASMAQRAGCRRSASQRHRSKRMVIKMITYDLKGLGR
jgi:hypothetical protein